MIKDDCGIEDLIKIEFHAPHRYPPRSPFGWDGPAIAYCGTTIADHGEAGEQQNDVVWMRPWPRDAKPFIGHLSLRLLRPRAMTRGCLVAAGG